MQRRPQMAHARVSPLYREPKVFSKTNILSIGGRLNTGASIGSRLDRTRVAVIISLADYTLRIGLLASVVSLTIGELHHRYALSINYASSSRC